MRLLVDTHLLLWAADAFEKLPVGAVEIMQDPNVDLAFSAVNIWEIMVKRALNRPDFQVDPRELRDDLVDAGYEEMDVTSEHALALEALPMLHRDPFDRLLIAQAIADDRQLLTSDRIVARYPGPILKV